MIILHEIIIVKVIITKNMQNKNPNVDLYLKDGCGRCKLYKLPQCKVHKWPTILLQLRNIALECGLTEELKWSVPVYTHNNKNILILTAFNDFCSLGFIKGVLLNDDNGILHQQGQSSQSARIAKFTSEIEVLNLKQTLKAYIAQAIENENAGQKVIFIKNPEPIPLELQQAFDNNLAFEKAFFGLTPGKQRGYIIHFSQPKQSKTREARIEKCTTQIMQGKGMMDK